MSSYLVEKEHMTALVGWIVENRLLGSKLTPQQWFESLVRENLDSVNLRYNEDNQFPEEWHNQQTFISPKKPNGGQKESNDFYLIGIYRLIKCYFYQSCDHHKSGQKLEDKSIVWQELVRVEQEILKLLKKSKEEIRKLKAFELAPWDYTDSEWQTYLNWCNQTPKERAATKLASDLRRFTGTTAYTRINRFANLLATDGVVYLMEKAGAYWFGDVIASVQYMPQIKAETMQFWELNVNLDKGEGVVLCHDGQGDQKEVYYQQKIPFTDFPLSKQLIYVSNTANGLIACLPSEY